ncbi:MAG: DUF6247 family protein [Pseudonocardiaceae bacterium]
MTATWTYDEQPRNGHPLLPGAAPHDIRAALLPEDRAAFDAAFDAAYEDAVRRRPSRGPHQPGPDRAVQTLEH